MQATVYTRRLDDGSCCANADLRPAKSQSVFNWLPLAKPGGLFTVKRVE
jgi:hypothetical protein